MYVVIASSTSSPAILIEDLVTIPPSEITATSLVPPPMSTTIDPCGSLTGSPAPIAAARGSSMVYACLAPADSVASLTARSSTPVTPLGTHTTTLGPTNDRNNWRRGCALRMKYESIFSVTSKSAITPSLRGRMATMLPGVLPSIRLAAEPTATTLSVLLSMATTEGSESTMPCPLTNTSVFAVPRSIATSRPKSPPNIRDPSSVSNDPAPPIRRLEYSVLLHTKVPVAQDHVIQDVDTDYLGCLLEPPRDLAVLAARSYLAAGVVMGEHYTRRARPDRRLEYLPGVNQRRRKCANRDNRKLYYLVLGVQEHRDEILPVEISDPTPQKTVNVLGR